MHARRPLNIPGAITGAVVSGRGLTFAVLATLTLAPALCHGQSVVSRTALLVLDPVKEEKPSESQPDIASRSQHASFRHGPVPYAINYHVTTDRKKPQEVLWTEGYLGMPGPTSCNWYGGGFLFLTLNGKDIGRTPLSSMRAAETTGRATLDLVWRHELADVRVRLVGLPEQDYLLCDIAIDRKPALQSVQAELRCYPSFFTAWHKRTGARRVQTPSVLVTEGETRQLPPTENWWALYYDEVFDVAKGEGEGPCALLVLPEDVASVTSAPGGYAVVTRLALAPGAQRLRLAFWDFKGRTNAEALARMQSAAPEVRRVLAGTDFTPAVLATFDAGKARQELQEALALAPARDLLGEHLKAAQSWVEESTSLPPADSVRGQEELFGVMERYAAVVWHVRLARLLADLP